MANIPADKNIDVLIPALTRALGGREGVLSFLKEIRPAIKPNKVSWTSYLLDCLDDFVSEDDEEWAKFARETPFVDDGEPLYKRDAELGDFVEIQRDQKV
jgi:hypothetical protein